MKLNAQMNYAYYLLGNEVFIIGTDVIFIPTHVSVFFRKTAVPEKVPLFVSARLTDADYCVALTDGFLTVPWQDVKPLQ